MNDTINTIKTRRSVRFYEDKPIPKDMLNTIIRCGTLAPSGFNSQPWRFVVVQSDQVKAKLRSLALPAYKEWLVDAPDAIKERQSQINDPVYYNAPVIIFVIGKGMTTDYDCPMACENMMLTARSLGIGSIWVCFGMMPTKTPEIQQVFEIQEDEKVYGPILLGYPKDGQFPDSPPKNEPVIKWM